MKTLPIVFACDKSYFKYTSVAICSLISNANKEVYYKIYVLSQDIDEKDQILMTEFIKEYKNFSLEFIFLNDFDSSKFYLNSYITASTYYRFYIPELFKQYDRILYLDSDLVIDADISEFADMDFEGNTAIAVQDGYVKNCVNNDLVDFPKAYFYNTLKLEDPNQYFNAGIILFNIKKINELNLSPLFFSTLFNEIKEPIFQDQDILNVVLSPKNKGGGVNF